MKSLSSRQENILLSLRKLDYLSRHQLQIIHRLGKVRNANRVLKDLSPYLSKFRTEYSTVYYLNDQGRAYLNTKKVRKKNAYVDHVLIRNDFYIFAGFPTDWRNEIKLSDGEFTVICDAWFKKDGRYQALEVDHLQKMKENRAKIRSYISLYKAGKLAHHLGYFPKIIWLTASELRKKQLEALCNGIPCQVLTVKEIK